MGEESVRAGKYWIEPGVCATHKQTGATVCVEKIVKGKEGDRIFIRGVMCHWLDDKGGYQKGMFMTMELEPCEK
jgi:hypothetical protein